jgi:hypothetical protein
MCVCVYVHTHISGPFFILQVTETTTYELVCEGYVIVQ